MHFMCSCCRSPVNRSMLKVALSTHVISCPHLIADRIAQEALFPPQTLPFISDKPMHFMRTCRRRPEDYSSLEVLVTTNSVCCRFLVTNGIAQDTKLPTQTRPFISNKPVDLVCVRFG